MPVTRSGKMLYSCVEIAPENIVLDTEKPMSLRFFWSIKIKYTELASTAAAWVGWDRDESEAYTCASASSDAFAALHRKP